MATVKDDSFEIILGNGARAINANNTYSRMEVFILAIAELLTFLAFFLVKVSLYLHKKDFSGKFYFFPYNNISQGQFSHIFNLNSYLATIIGTALSNGQ
jgi:hypothetical protein